jgi:hypothetical protein
MGKIFSRFRAAQPETTRLVPTPNPTIHPSPATPPQPTKKEDLESIVGPVVAHFMTCPISELMPNPDTFENSVLERFASCGPEIYPPKHLITLFDRIPKTQPPPKSQLLMIALAHRQYIFAAYLIKQHHAFDVVGYFNVCAERGCSEAIECANMLIDEGYRMTGKARSRFCSHESTALRAVLMPHYVQDEKLALRLCAFCDLDGVAFQHMAVNSYGNAFVTAMRRVQLHSLSYDAEFGTIATPLYRVLMAFLNGENAIDLAIMLRHLLRCFNGDTRGSLRIPCETSSHVEILVYELARQGADYRSVKSRLPDLHEMMQPWSVDRNYKFYNQEFRQLAYELALAVDMSGEKCQLPYEMFILLVQFLRTD